MRFARFFLLPLASTMLALGACGGDPAPDGDSAEADPAPAPTLDIHRSHGAGAGAVNSYWLEGEDAILVFDVQSNPDLAARVVERIEATGKPVETIIVSHYHPDHFGGLRVFLEAFPDAEFATAESIAEQLAEDPLGYVEALAEQAGEDETRAEDAGEVETSAEAADEEWEPLPEPDRLLVDNQQLSVSGVPVTVEIIASAESSPILMLAVPGQKLLLASDMVSANVHPNLVDANIDSWPRELERITRDFTGYRLYPGHGEPGPTNLLAANQIAYLTFMRRLVTTEILDDEDDRATEGEIRDAITRIERNYPDWGDASGRPGYLRRNLEALVRALGGEVERAAGRPPSEEERMNAEARD
ncbi:MAG: MBL fold metallo-hydrolase [Parasphingopyxis sp.]|nr:MBL fold metallo-hydrolase [Sphingomonadales bacterium]